MNDYQMAKRIADTVVMQGWDSVYDYELTKLHNNKKFEDLVYELISKLKRGVELEGSDYTFKDIDIGNSNHKRLFSIIWENRKAELWTNPRKKRAILEVKQWNEEIFKTAFDIGSHRYLVKKTISEDQYSELKAICLDVLLDYGCPRKKIEDKFQS